MFLVLLFAISLTISGASTVLGKYFQLGIKNNLPTMIMYNFINAIFGSIAFFIICKFHIEMNLITFIYSVVYALMVINSLAIGVVALSKVSIPFNAIIGMAGSVIGASFFGVTMFGEEILLNQFLAMFLLIGSVAVTAFASPELKKSKNSVPVCIWQFMTGFLNVPIIKMYTITDGALPINNMFFMTNFIVVIVSGIYVAWYFAKNGIKTSKIMFADVTSLKAISNIGSRTLLSNVASIISAMIIARMDLTLNNILGSALSLILTGCISKFVFKERLFRENYISIGLALAAIVVRVI